MEKKCSESYYYWYRGQDINMDISLQSDISPDPTLEALTLRNKANSNELGAEGQQNGPTEPDEQPVTTETNPEISKPKRGRGRPRKRPIMAALDAKSKPKRGRGRPRTKMEDWPSRLPTDWQPMTNETNPEESKPKRGRGRPRKRPIMAALDAESKPKRGRGRPRANKEDWPSWLPNDWQIIQKTRQHGGSAGHVDKYYISPHGDFGHQYRSKKDVLAHICVSSAEGDDKKQHTVMADDLIGQ